MAIKKRLIYLEDVRNALYDAYAITMKGVAIINQFPTVDAVEVVHGCNVYDHDTSFECSVCGWGDWDTMTADSCKYNYCPNCGAKMDGDGNE